MILLKLGTWVKMSLFCMFGNFHHEIFFKRATCWVRKLHTAEVPSCEPLTVAAATAAINRKFMNLYGSSSVRHCCTEWEDSSYCGRRVLAWWKLGLQPLFSAQTSPRCHPLPPSRYSWQSIRVIEPLAITIPTASIPYWPQHEFSRCPIHVHPILLFQYISFLSQNTCTSNMVHFASISLNSVFP